MTDKTETEGKYLIMLSVHGLIRGHDHELGRDADTGGQVKYVVDLARALGEHSDFRKVDLVTRRLVDDHVSADYAEPVEHLSDNVRIIRIDGGPEEYLPKEQLWDHLDSLTDNLVTWLHDEGERPDLVHSHYADAGYVGVRLANNYGVPLIHTGHSLGRDKRKQLLAKGVSREQIEETYTIGRRIDAEEEVLANAALVITSTHNEIEQQYGLYNYYDPKLMEVIPPGTNLGEFHPPEAGEEFSFREKVDRFLDAPDKPLILALSRPDERKNILALIEAYGESEKLQSLANLLIVAGSREDIRDLDSGAQSVLTNILLLIDAYDLYGKVAVPKSHTSDQVPSIYRMAAASGGVVINPALTEPFGLTLLEAAASGLPVVATENGGPVDIIANCANGELIDPLDREAIATALEKLLGDEAVWREARDNGLKGVREHYSWQAHAESYVAKLNTLFSEYPRIPEMLPIPKGIRYRDRAIFTDLDQNLLGDEEALAAFSAFIRQNRKSVTFGVATGRRVDSALALMKKHHIPTPDVLITSLGTRIQYGQGLTEDDVWDDHIDHHWSPRRVRQVMQEIPGVERQRKSEQTGFKLSYYYDAERAPPVDVIMTLLRKNELAVNVVLSFGQFLDILPVRASKGQALRFVAQRMDIPLEHILVAGGSGADEDMMRGNTLAVVVANRHHEELSGLDEQESVYFAQTPFAGGIMEAIEHYDFLSERRDA